MPKAITNARTVHKMTLQDKHKAQNCIGCWDKYVCTRSIYICNGLFQIKINRSHELN